VVVVAHGCAMEILSKVHLAEHALRLALIKLLPTKCFTFRIAVRWFGGAVVHWELNHRGQIEHSHAECLANCVCTKI